MFFHLSKTSHGLARVRMCKGGRGTCGKGEEKHQHDFYQHEFKGSKFGLNAKIDQFWLTGEVPNDWRLVTVMPIYKKGWKEDPGNHRPVNWTLVPGKVMKQIILSVITQHMQDSQEIRPCQHGLTKDQSCLTDLVSSYDKVVCLMHEEKAVDVVYLDVV
ncbi:rna-directed dna polymerase from mobile element jockey-like [Pitangus sulphuratus]|nr:rna-directed dna polymerase from mobile element jockey-like [Pitangus sulphuratus]